MEKTFSLSLLKISSLFPVQETIFPMLLSPLPKRNDLLVKAKTGSGKTIAYVVPIVQTLKKRIVPRLAALVILPTRNLANQVKVVFDHFVKGTDLKVAICTGQTSFIAEQKIFVDFDDDGIYNSKIDILIATPGRLIDHLKSTTGFTLEHLRFLVIDEADRLLNQKYNNWLNIVLDATTQSIQPIIETQTVFTKRKPMFKDQPLLIKSCQSFYTPLQKLLFSATLTSDPGKLAELNLFNPLFVNIETTTTDSFNLPSTVEQFQFFAPDKLEEKIIAVNSGGKKPVLLVHLLTVLGLKGVLVFVKSVEAAHRLAALVNIFATQQKQNSLNSTNHSSSTTTTTSSSSSSSTSSSSSSDEDSSDSSDSSNPQPTTSTQTPQTLAKAFSSTISANSKRKLLNSFKSGSLQCLICSDVMSRGVDLGESVSTVVNYDIPKTCEAYVHRIGRTARAGRVGLAVTILESAQVKFFKLDIAGKVGRGEKKVSDMKIAKDQVFSEKNMTQFAKSLQVMEGLVRGNNKETVEIDNEKPLGDEESDLEEDEIDCEDADDDDDVEMEEVGVSDVFPVCNISVQTLNETNEFEDILINGSSSKEKVKWWK